MIIPKKQGNIPMRTKEVKIILAKTAGMCYGVKKALGIAEQVAEEKGGGIALGKLIHNADAIKDLEEKGIQTIENVRDCPKDKTLIIRSHGVGRSVYGEITEQGINYADATCADIKRIHKIVAENSAQGADIIIAGEANHPEVQGIIGHKDKNKGRCFVVNSLSDLENVLKSEICIGENTLIMLAQTTYDKAKWKEYKKFIEKYYTKVKIFDTICNATIKRKEEAELLSEMCNLMVVLGSPDSNNSKTLAEICRRRTETVFIENASGLDIERIKVFLSAEKDVKITIGITAGASTPAYIIKEVHNIMSEELKNGVAENTETNIDGDIDFMAEVDKTFKRIYIGNRVKAYVVAVNKTEAIVDLGTKHSGYIPADELTNDSSKLPSDVVNVGDEIDCLVTSINDAEGVVYLSKKRIDAVLGFEKLSAAAENNAVLEGVVTAVVKGGLIIVCEGARVFVPASQSGVPKSGKLEDLQKKNVKFKIIEINEARGRVVGSIKAVQREENEVLRNKFWSEIEEGKRFTGEVKSIESYGVFVDLGGVDGMVHLSELTWNRIKHPRELVSVGDKLEVYVKSFDPERKRVSLGARDPKDNPWVKFLNEFKADDTVKVQIVSITPFGAFAQIIPGVDGLIHISQITKERVNNVAQVLSPGQVVDAKITEIDAEKSRVSLSMKALIEDTEQISEDENADTEPALVYSDDNGINTLNEETENGEVIEADGTPVKTEEASE